MSSCCPEWAHTGDVGTRGFRERAHPSGLGEANVSDGRGPHVFDALVVQWRVAEAGSALLLHADTPSRMGMDSSER
jgi:hypothetical protein